MNEENTISIKEKVCCFENLYKAMNECKLSVMWKDSVAGWVKNGITNCLQLEDQLMNNTYTIDKYSEFTIYEPKKRDIISTRFKDRVFQRSLCDNYLTKQVTKSFIYDNCACLRNKGTEFARRRFVNHLQKFYRKYGTNGYVLQCDIKNFFGSTPHKTIKEKMKKLCDDEWAYNEVCKIIDSFSKKENPGIGMGLGSQVTQICQLAVLNDMDHYIKEQKHIKHYIRYVDDFILIHKSKDMLKECLEYINNELNKMGLKLSDKKTQIFPITQPIHFLGYSFKLTETGKVVKKILPEKLSHERKKLYRMKHLVNEGKMTIDKLDKCFESFLSHLTNEPSDKRKGTPFLCRTDDFFRINKMKRFYNDIKKDINI